MALVGVSQHNHNNQQIDDYEYDDMDNFYDDGVNFGNYLDVDDSEGESRKATSSVPHQKIKKKIEKKTYLNVFFLFW